MPSAAHMRLADQEDAFHGKAFCAAALITCVALTRTLPYLKVVRLQVWKLIELGTRSDPCTRACGMDLQVRAIVRV